MKSWRCDVGEITGKCGGSLVSTMAVAREHRKRRRRFSSDTTTVAVMMAIMLVLSISTAVEGTRHRDFGDRKLHHQTYDVAKVRSDPLLLERERWLRQTAAISRILDENGDDDAAAQEGYDDANAGDNVDDAINDDGYSTPSPTPMPSDATDDYEAKIQRMCQDKTCSINEQCTKYLFGFLQGTTDANDSCEGIMNAYKAAKCGDIVKDYGGATGSSAIYDETDDYYDDYFGIFHDHQCCNSLRGHYHEYCDKSEAINGFYLLLIAGVMLLCECAKSIVKKNRVRWLPEAAACMLVGMSVALIAKLFRKDIDETIGFDAEIFMYLLLPPIIFEAALSVNKGEFRRRRGAIMVFAVFGTIMSSFITGTATYYGAQFFWNGKNSLTLLDSLIFGSLISSIDPVAILSVLTRLKMSETDTIYILVFGESLLNDGIAITLFKSLAQQYERETLSMTFDDILGAVADFFIIASGSCFIGFACGVACLCYFHLNSSILDPVMEVASFFLWAVVPYWLSEALGWSGIVAIVVMGFFMDIYLRPGWDPADLEVEEDRRRLLIEQEEQRYLENNPDTSPHDGYHTWEDEQVFRFRGTAVDIPLPRPAPPPRPGDQDDDQDKTTKQSNIYDADSLAGTSMTTNPNIKAILMKRENVRMSREADEHVRFVAHILSSMSENAIFAYLGLFLFSSQYKWDGILCSIGVTSCIVSRALMVICASKFIWYMHIFRQRAGCNGANHNDDPCIGDEGDTGNGLSGEDIDPLTTPISKSARALSNYKVQVVLILAGLRGAVSLALVETVPIYNAVTDVGTKNKKLLKAMTSSAILFTIFVLGGSAYFILTWLDISSDEMLIKSTKKRRRLSIYPHIACGGRGEAEMELTTAPSWRNYPLSPIFSASPRPGISRDHSNDALHTSRSSYTMNRTQSEMSSSSAGLNKCVSLDNKILRNESSTRYEGRSEDITIKTATSSPPQLI